MGIKATWSIQNNNSTGEISMKAIREVTALLVTNAGIGITAIVSIIGLFIGGLYLIELAENLFVSMTSPSVRQILSISISSILALYLLAIFGSWVREKVEDIIWEYRSQRQISK